VKRLDGQAVRALALGLPEASEQPHMTRTSFRVGKRIFATMAEDEQQLNVRVTPPRQLYELLAAHPGALIALGGWSRLGWLGVDLSRADPQLVRELVVAAWRRLAPKRALAAYDGAPPAKRKR
jgi:hypothetical protein